MGLDNNFNEEKVSPTDLELRNQIAGNAKPLPRKLKLFTAAAIFWGNLTFGCAYNTYGPTLTSMQNKYEVDDETIARALTILTGFYMIGALSGGIIYNYINRQLAVIAILGTIGATMILTPFCPTLATFYVTAGVMGVCCGAYDVAQFAWMMEMMQIECPPYVQTQHFFYALGTITASLVMAPFLDEKTEDATTTTAAMMNSNTSFLSEINAIADEDEKGKDKLFIPYTIVGCINLAASAYHIILFIFLRYRAPPPEVFDEISSEEKNGTKEGQPEIMIGPWPWPKLRYVLLCCCLYGAYQGMEMCTFQFFPKFGQNSDLNLSEAESTYVLTGMNIAFATGRAIAIVAVFKINCQLILCLNLFLNLLGNILLVGWANNSLYVLWASSILYGLGFSSTFASYSAYIERYLNFSNFIASLMIICGSGLAAIYPLVIGKFIEDNPIVLTYTTFFSLALMIFAFSTASYLTYKSKKRY